MSDAPVSLVSRISQYPGWVEPDMSTLDVTAFEGEVGEAVGLALDGEWKYRIGGGKIRKRPRRGDYAAALVENFGIVTNSCRTLGVNRRTFYRVLAQDAELKAVQGATTAILADVLEGMYVDFALGKAQEDLSKAERSLLNKRMSVIWNLLRSVHPRYKAKVDVTVETGGICRPSCRVRLTGTGCRARLTAWLRWWPRNDPGNRRMHRRAVAQ